MEKSSHAADYFKTLSERKSKSHVYVKHQSLGLALADILGDRSHKALYMKFAKEYDGTLLLTVAKDIATRTGVKNKGAYFMKMFSTFRSTLPRKTFPKKEKKVKPEKPKQLTLAFKNGKKK